MSVVGPIGDKRGRWEMGGGAQGARATHNPHTSLPYRAAVHLLETHKLDALFDRTDGAGSLDFRKPSPRALLAHLARLRVAVATAAYVGDSAGDMKMAVEGGVFAIGVGWSPIGPRALKQAGAGTIISRYSELQRLPIARRL